MTHGEKAEIKEIAREIVKEVLLEHVASCPHGITMLKMRWMVAGIIVAAAGSSAGTAALLKVLTGF